MNEGPRKVTHVAGVLRPEDYTVLSTTLKSYAQIAAQFSVEKSLVYISIFRN